MILWGPPGVGKTTLARLTGPPLRRRLHPDIGGAGGGQGNPRGGGTGPGEPRPWAGRPSCSSTRCTASTRASRTPSCPTWSLGLVTFIGATTENPSFEVVGALLSRAQVYVLKSLDEAGLAASCWNGPWPWADWASPWSPKEESCCMAQADGDGRRLLNLTGTVRYRHEGRRPRQGRRRLRRRGPGALPTPLRQGRRRLLRPDLRPAQVGARLQSRRLPVLVHPHAGRRCRPSLPGPAPPAHGGGGRGPGRSPGR
jgi:hypothetical protein